LVTFVGLVTFTVSFLGTILCAAMIGMMVGFSRKWKWQTLAVSLVFPVILLASLHASSAKSELPLADSLRLAAVCFGTFWMTYLATRGLVLLEGGNREPSGATTNRQPRTQAEPKPFTPSRAIDIGELQGVWVQETTRVNGEGTRKIINVNKDELTLSVLGEDGKPQLLASGQLQILKPGRS